MVVNILDIGRKINVMAKPYIHFKMEISMNIFIPRFEGTYKNG